MKLQKSLQECGCKFEAVYCKYYNRLPLPLTFSYVELKYSAAAVCIIATVAAIFEWNCIRKRIEV